MVKAVDLSPALLAKISGIWCYIPRSQRLPTHLASFLAFRIWCFIPKVPWTLFSPDSALSPCLSIDEPWSPGSATTNSDDDASLQMMMPHSLLPSPRFHLILISIHSPVNQSRTTTRRSFSLQPLGVSKIGIPLPRTILVTFLISHKQHLS